MEQMHKHQKDLRCDDSCSGSKSTACVLSITAEVATVPFGGGAVLPDNQDHPQWKQEELGSNSGSARTSVVYFL